jgi:hypothetical protein
MSDEQEQSLTSSADLVGLKNKAQLALLLGIASVAFGLICAVPIGPIALFMGIQAKAGLMRLESPEGQAQARAAIFLGGVGLFMFLAALAYNLWPLLSRSR